MFEARGGVGSRPSGEDSKKSTDSNCLDPKVVSPFLDKVASVLGVDMVFHWEWRSLRESVRVAGRRCGVVMQWVFGVISVFLALL